MAQVAPLVRRPVEIDPEALYPEIGVRSFGRGTFHKPSLEGAAVGTKRLFEIHSGDLLFNIVFAWEGAVAVVQPSDHGRFGSHRFLTCVCDPKLAEPNFLAFYFATQIGRAQLLQASPGGAGRNRTLGLRALEDIRVPLPPLEEQRRLVAQIDRINASVNEARNLLQNAADEALKVSRALLYGRGRVASPLVSVGDLVRQRPMDVIVSPDEEYHFAGVYSFGRGVFAGEKKKGIEFAYKMLTRLRNGDFTYPKLMAWEGALGIVPVECDGLVVSPEFPVFELDRDRVLPDVLDIYFRDPMIWPSLKGDSPGTNVRRRRLNPSTFLSLKIPLPSMPDQRSLAAVRVKLSEAASARARSLDELDALLGCLLRRIFGNARDPLAAADERTAA